MITSHLLTEVLQQNVHFFLFAVVLHSSLCLAILFSSFFDHCELLCLQGRQCPKSIAPAAAAGGDEFVRSKEDRKRGLDAFKALPAQAGKDHQANLNAFLATPDGKSLYAKKKAPAASSAVSCRMTQDAVLDWMIANQTMVAPAISTFEKDLHSGLNYRC